MSIALTPGYSDIFGTPTPSIDEILNGISSEAVLIALSYINGQIDQSSYKNQGGILAFLLRNAPGELQEELKKRLVRFNRSNDGRLLLFNKLYVTEFILYVLQNQNEIEEDTTPEHEYRILQAYFAIIEREQNSQSKVYDQIDQNRNKYNDDFFYQMMWPIASSQFQFNDRPLSLYESTRAFLLADELTYNTKYSESIKEFEKKKGNSLLSLISTLLQITSYKGKFTSGHWTAEQFFISQNESYNSILDKLCINGVEERELQRKDYFPIKKYPLFKIRNGSYLVLNWDFLAKSVYVGLLFSLYQESEISTIHKNFPEFKGYIGKDISEKRLFEPTLRFLFQKNHHKLHFDEGDGTPDAYLRIGRRIYLFEFKDMLAPSRVAISEDFEIVKEEIRKKLIENEKGEQKGISQLINHLNFLEHDSFEFDSFEENGIVRQKIEVYPLVVYTDFFYSMPGVSTFLMEQFDAMYENTAFKKVYPPTLVDMKFIFRHLFGIKWERLDQLIKSYLQQLKRKQKTIPKKLNPDDWIAANLSFYHLVRIGHNIAQPSKDDVKRYYETLQIRFFNEKVED